jgi:autotransporter-associated beta strand repeat
VLRLSGTKHWTGDWRRRRRIRLRRRTTSAAFRKPAKAAWRVILIGALLWSVSRPALAIFISEDYYRLLGGQGTDQAGYAADILQVMRSLREASMAPQFMSVVRIPGCTGTWLGDSADGSVSYILTAAHCVERGEVGTYDGQVVLHRLSDGNWSAGVVASGGGTSYRPADVADLDDSFPPARDIAILAVPKVADLTLPDGTPVARPRLYIGTNVVGKPVTLLGYGTWGVAGVGPLVAPSPDAPEPRRSMGESIITEIFGGGALRAGYDAANGGASGKWARSGSGDSGSAWWQNQGGVWSIIAEMHGQNGVASSGASMSDHWQWIRSIFPDVLLYDYRDAPVTDFETHVFDNLLLQAAAAGSLGTGLVKVDPKGELWTVVDNALDMNELFNEGLVITRNGSTQKVSRLEGTGTLSLEDTSRLIVDMAQDGAYSGPIQGTGTLVKTGAGTFSLSGPGENFTGSADVQAGTLVVDSGFAHARVDVGHGATIAGNGVLGSLTVSGTLSPGTPGLPGTLSVSGDVTFMSGSLYDFQIDSTGAADRLVAGGAVHILGGVLQLTAGDEVILEGRRYEAITAAGGVSGTFDSFTTNLVFLTPQLQYETGAVVVSFFRNEVSAPAVFEKRNQKAAAAAVDRLPEGHPLRQVMLSSSWDELQHLFERLPGEIHASTFAVLTGSTGALPDAARDRFRLATAESPEGLGSCWSRDDPGRLDLRCVQPKRRIWTASQLTDESFAAGEAGGTGVDASSGTFLAGVEVTDHGLWMVGAAAGYSSLEFANRREAGGSGRSFHGMVYAMSTDGPARFGGGLSASLHSLAMGRRVTGKFFDERLNAAAAGSTLQAFVDASFEMGDEVVSIFPHMGLRIARTYLAEMPETRGISGLMAVSGAHLTAESRVGVRGESRVRIDDHMSLNLHAGLAYEAALVGEQTSRRLKFLDTNSAFTVYGAQVPVNTVSVEAGVTAEFDGLNLDVSYTGRNQGDEMSHTISGAINVRF